MYSILINNYDSYCRGYQCYIYILTILMQSVVRCVWHPKLNQIMVGCGDGKARIFFSPTHSQRFERRVKREGAKDEGIFFVLCRGAKMCVVKKKRKKLEGVSSGEQQIIARMYVPAVAIYGRSTSF